MNKKNYIILTLLLALSAMAFYIYSSNFNSTLSRSDTSIILYVQDGCPHCANVEDYISANNVANKVAFMQKDLTSDQPNLNDLLVKAKICGLSQNSIGTPFLWDGQNSKCLMGDEDVINFFKERAASSSTAGL